ncbi:MAG TPA: patatin-like phospholipase family protein [Burkholderiales bacterium]|nr:patatin-like phospholipase family protein [Burkholderiales bacterium]
MKLLQRLGSAPDGKSFEAVREEELKTLGADPERLMGLALSGGGIRSATFNLGVIQGLAKHGLLKRFEYLSTVSGGGYIGSWLSAWAARPGCGIAKVEEALAAAREPRQVSYLREYSNYLTPRMGWLSADTLTMGATFIRNLLLNLTIIVCYAAVVLLVPWLLGWLPQAVSHGALLASSALMLVLALTGLVGNIVWQEIEENRPDPPGGVSPPARSRPFHTQAAFITVLIVLPLVLSAYALSMVPQAYTTLMGHWRALAGVLAFIAVAALAGLVVLRWRSGISRLGAQDLARRTLAVVVGPIAGMGMIAYAAGVLTGMDVWHRVVWGVPLLIGAFLLTVTITLGLSGRSESEYAREWWSRLGGLVTRAALTWLVLCAASIYGPLLMQKLGAFASANLSLTWLVTTIAAVLAGKHPGTGKEGSRRWRELLPRIGPYVFMAGLLIGISTALFTWVAVPPWVIEWDWTYFKVLSEVAQPLVWDAAGNVDVTHSVLLVMLILSLTGLLLTITVDVNLFSFHMFYRNRLVRCYLGASNPNPRPLPFIGFDPRDNPKLTELEQRPYHIINTGMNMTSSEHLGWQERKAASFVLSRDFCGYEFPKVGPSIEKVKKAFQPTRDFTNGRGSINLGTAMAISGAAASPNMGYHSSPSVAFLLTVFNVRLGWWMQNTSSQRNWKGTGPHFGLRYLMFELFGLSNDKSRFVQLSDGGHFDNLGVYELVRRKCRFIVVSDASQDKDSKFEDLGNVIRKCYVDLDVKIDVSKRAIVADPANKRSLYHCVVGTIDYGKDFPAGYLLYLKPSLTGNEPSDVAQYAAACPAFPHESTNDQWFSESQFESYRRLGFHIIDTVFSEALDPETATGVARGEVSMERVFVALKERWSAPSSAGAGAFARHGDEYSRLQDTLRTNPLLAFLNWQVYPEWDALTRGTRRSEEDLPTAERKRKLLWLPDRHEELRAGFHFCNSVLTLMENVYVDLNLQQEHEHPDNRGWMNLFRQWSWSGMFKVTYAVCCSMYGARFQTFCERELKLKPGEVRVTECTDGAREQSLNFLENKIIQALSDAEIAYDRDRIRLFQTVVWSPDVIDRDADPDRRFVYTFGFALTAGSEIVYFRIQDHLRKMGHAREALSELLRIDPALVEARTRAVDIDALKRLEAPKHEAFDRLFRSVRQQRMQ